MKHTGSIFGTGSTQQQHRQQYQ